jgi:hypothetical protein
MHYNINRGKVVHICRLERYWIRANEQARHNITEDTTVLNSEYFDTFGILTTKMSSKMIEYFNTFFRKLWAHNLSTNSKNVKNEIKIQKIL